MSYDKPDYREQSVDSQQVDLRMGIQDRKHIEQVAEQGKYPDCLASNYPKHLALHLFVQKNMGTFAHKSSEKKIASSLLALSELAETTV